MITLVALWTLFGLHYNRRTCFLAGHDVVFSSHYIEAPLLYIGRGNHLYFTNWDTSAGVADRVAMLFLRVAVATPCQPLGVVFPQWCFKVEACNSHKGTGLGF